MSRAFREGWERIFGRKPGIIRNPFNIRPGLRIHYEVPDDFTVRDLRRLVRHLSTMCEDWEPEHGLAEVEFPGLIDERVDVNLGVVP